MLGIAWPAMRATFDVELAALGFLIAATTASYFVSTALVGPLDAQLGATRLAVLAASVAAAGLALLATAPTWAVAIGAAVVVGLGSGVLDAELNAYIALTGGVRAMGLLHGAWAVGAALGPGLVFAATSDGGSWRVAYAIAAIALGAVALSLIGLRPVAHVVRETASLAADVPRPAHAKVLLALGAAMFFVYVGVEGGTGQWAFVDLAETRGLPAVVAGWAVALYWAALAGGRFALGVAGHRVRAERLLDASVALALAGALGYLVLPPLAAGLVALPALSLGLSVFFPVLMSFTPARVGAGATVHAVGIQFAAGTVGGGLFPALMGLAIQSYGASALGACALALAIALAGLHVIARRVSAGEDP